MAFASPSGRRLGSERGAMLSLIAFSTCIVLLTLGTTYIVAAQNMFLTAVQNQRLAQAREFARSGLEIACSNFAASGAEAKGAGGLDGAVGEFVWETSSAGGDRATIRVEGSAGAGRDRVAVHISAEAQRVPGARSARILWIRSR